MAASRTLKLSILGDVDGLNKSLKAATQDVETFGDKMGKVGKAVGAALAAAAVAAGAMAIKIGVDAVKAASDLSETISKVGVLFGDTSKDIEKFAASAAGSLGQTKQQALDAAATFATFGKAAGLSGKDLSNFSIDFVKLSSDLASFNNTSPEQAINAIGSALRGEAEPLRAYGVLLDDASLRQAALELGIVSTTKNALTPQQKVLAAQKLIFEQTGAAQGDFARTSDGLANRTRILTAQLENAKVTIGDALLPIVLEMATFISEKVIPIIEQFSESFGDKQGALGGTIRNVADVIKSVAVPIFEGMKTAFDKIKKTIVENKDEFQAFFDLLKAAAPIIGKVVGTAFSVIGDIASVVLNVMGTVVTALKGLINTAIDLVNIAIRGMNIIKPGADISYVSKIGSSSGSTSTGGISVPAASLPSGFKPATTTTTGGGTTGGGVTGGSTGGTSISSVAASAAKAATSSNNIVTGSFNAGRFREAEMRDSGTTINLTVTGAFEPEGTARTIVDTLNNSWYRGTGGGSNLQGIA